MPPRFTDYFVSYRTEESIAEIALSWRKAGGIFNDANFDIVTFVEKVLTRRLKKDVLRIEFFNSDIADEFAFVTYEPLTLHIEKEIWNDAKMGEPKSRHILAHEIGHIILHDHYAQRFSNDPSKQLNFLQNENSAEWQANRFADHFLAPDHLVRGFCNSFSLAQSCLLLSELAGERFSKVHQARHGYSGELCPNCNNFSLIRKGLLQGCSRCGTSMMS